MPTRFVSHYEKGSITFSPAVFLAVVEKANSPFNNVLCNPIKEANGDDLKRNGYEKYFLRMLEC